MSLARLRLMYRYLAFRGQIISNDPAGKLKKVMQSKNELFLGDDNVVKYDNTLSNLYF